MRRLPGVILLLLALCSSACKKEPSYQKEQFTGHWAVHNAERDGKVTSLLNGAIFQFQEDGTMNTNITGQENSGSFDLTGNEITFAHGEELKFVISTFHGDTLSLSTELQGMHFILDLHRTNTESQ